MDCHHYDAGRCRSCSWLTRPYDEQLARKQERAASLLADHSGLRWEPWVASTEAGFRNKAKMVVGGTIAEPVLGILGPSGTVADLQDCGIHEPAVREALPVIAEFITRAALEPYDVATRRGELKYVLVTCAPDGRLMVRFVSRSQEPVTRVRKHLPWLHDHLPGLLVATVNLQPVHAAVLEGAEEIVLTPTSALPMPVNDIELLLRPQSFFQTNTAIAGALYRSAREIVTEVDPSSVWDLYCGVGGFALHLAGPGRAVTGVESSAEAVESARTSAASAAARARFTAADATAWALEQPVAPDLVVLNPPRRGIGAQLAAWLDASTASHVLYSSCNPETLALDLAAMPSFDPVTARVFDMFPHTEHVEVLTLLRRSA